MPELKIKIGGDTTGFQASIEKTVGMANSGATQIVAAHKRAFALMTAEEARAAQRSKDIEAASRANRLAGLRREREEARRLSYNGGSNPEWGKRTFAGNRAPGEKQGSSVGGEIAAIGAGVGVLATMAGRVVAQNADAFKNLSDQTGISTDKLQQWAEVAKQAGKDGDFIGTAVTKLGVTISKALANPEGEEALNLRKLGLAIEDIDASDLEGSFEKIGNYLNQANVDAKVLGATVGTFGRGGAGIISVFKQGLDSGGIYDNRKDIDSIDELGDAWTRFKGRWTRIGTAIGGTVSRAVLGAKDSILPKSFGELGGGGKKILSDSEKKAIALANNTETPQDKKDREEATSLDKKLEESAEKDQRDMMDRTAKLNEDIQQRVIEQAYNALEPEEKKNQLLKERQSLMADIGKISEFTAEEIAQKSLRVLEIDGSVAGIGTPKTKTGSSPLNINPDAAAKMGMFIGGNGPGGSSVNDILGKQQLNAQQEIVKRINASIVVLNRIAAKGAGNWGER